MFMLNPQHTGKSIYNAPERSPVQVNSIAFSPNTSNPNAGVINADGEIYVVGGNGALYAYTHSFTLKWTTPFSISNYPFFGTPALTKNGTLYVSSTTTLGQKYFYAIVDNGFYGGLKWSYALDVNDGNISTSPVLDLSNNIYFGTDKGILYGISDATVQGILGWQYPNSGGISVPNDNAITGTPSIDLSYNKLCYTTSNTITSESIISVLDVSRNSIFRNVAPTERWAITRNDGYYTTPSIGNGAVYAGSTNGNVYAYDISNSNVVLTVNLSDTNLSPIAINNDKRIYLTSQKALHSIDISNAFLEWSYPIDPTGASVSNNSIPIIDASNNIFFGTRSNYLYSINGAQRLFNWRYGVGGAIQGMPVIGDNNNIYVGANNGLFYDFSGNSNVLPTTTAIVPMYMLNVRHTNLSAYYGPTIATIPAIYWQKPFVSGNLFVSPSIAISSTGALYLGSNDGYVYSLNAVDGSLNWLTRVNNTDRVPFNSPNSMYTTPVIGPDSTIYIGSNEGYLYALNPNGTLKWSYQAGYPLQSSPIMDGSGSLYFGAGNLVYAIGDAGFAGYPKWLNPFATNANVNSSPAIGSNGYLYFGSDDGYVYAVDSFTGSFKWSYNASTTLPAGIHPIYTSPSVDGSCNVIIGNGSYMNGVLYYLDGTTGAMLWTKTDFITAKVGPFYNTVAIRGDTLYLSTIAYVYAINRLNGVTKWYFYKTNCYYTSVAIDASGTLYFGSVKAKDIDGFLKNDGVLHCVTDVGNDWQENWALQVCRPGRLAPPVIGLNQTIYISSTANSIYAIK